VSLPGSIFIATKVPELAFLNYLFTANYSMQGFIQDSSSGGGGGDMFSHCVIIACVSTPIWRGGGGLGVFPQEKLEFLR
jgi:hypothetical protein